MTGRTTGLLGALLLTTACGADSSSDANPDSTAASEESTVETQPAPSDADASAASAGTSLAALTLDGVDYRFEEFVKCDTFGYEFMSGSARDADGRQIDFSWEIAQPDDDGDDAEYANYVAFEPADGDAQFKAGSVTGLVADQWGSLLWTRDGDTITGTGGFVNTYDPGSLPVDGEFALTCAR